MKYAKFILEEKYGAMVFWNTKYVDLFNDAKYLAAFSWHSHDSYKIDTNQSKEQIILQAFINTYLRVIDHLSSLNIPILKNTMAL